MGKFDILQIGDRFWRILNPEGHTFYLTEGDTLAAVIDTGMTEGEQILGCFYVVVIGAFLLFEAFPVNYRPVLIEGILEASYPSSTTMLVLCVMPTAMLQIWARFKKCLLLQILLAAFTGFMVVARLISGVHWFTDILGGILLSGGLVLMYQAFIRK